MPSPRTRAQRCADNLERIRHRNSLRLRIARAHAKGNFDEALFYEGELIEEEQRDRKKFPHLYPRPRRPKHPRVSSGPRTRDPDTGLYIPTNLPKAPPAPSQHLTGHALDLSSPHGN